MCSTKKVHVQTRTLDLVRSAVHILFSQQPCLKGGSKKLVKEEEERRDFAGRGVNIFPHPVRNVSIRTLQLGKPVVT